MSSIEESIKEVDAQWYNAVVNGLKLDPQTFQLFQGSAPLDQTSEAIWNTLDAVPPLSITQYFNPGQNNVFSTDYGAVLFRLKAQGEATFQSALGDYYSKWVTAWQAYTGDKNILEYFQVWASKNTPPDVATNGYSALMAMANDPVVKAQELWVNSGGSGRQKAYNSTIAALRAKLPSGQSMSADFDSVTSSKDVSNTWAKASVSGMYRFFSAGVGGEYKKLTEKILGSTLLVSASFQHVVTFPAGPLSKESLDPVLKDFKPWYSSALLHSAYSTPDNTLWMHGTPNWDSTFGPAGNMKRVCAALVVVDGIEMEVTASATLEEHEREEFKVAARAGFWPFFKAQGAGGWSHSYDFDDEGAATVSSTCDPGNPNIIGVIVTPAPNYMNT